VTAQEIITFRFINNVPYFQISYPVLTFLSDAVRFMLPRLKSHSYCAHAEESENACFP